MIRQKIFLLSLTMLVASSAEAYSRVQSGEMVAQESLALFDKGLELTALQKLFSIKDPAEISAKTVALLKAKIPLTTPLWRETDIKWSSQWASVFTPRVGDMILAWNTHDLKSEADFGRAEALAKRLPQNSNERAWLDWQIGLGRILAGQTNKAVARLQLLLDSSQKLVSQDEIMMTVARIMFQDQKFDGALHFYSAISKGSDFWLDSLEERAWTYVRLNDYEKALGSYQTLMTPVFAPQVGPEAYLIGSFSDLKVCDYNGVFEALKNFKGKYKDLIPELQALAKNGSSAATDRALAKLSRGPVSWASLGSDVGRLPQYFNRDVILLKALDKRNSYRAEAAKAQNLGELAIARNDQTVVQNQNRIIAARVKILAAGDLEVLAKITQKLHIVEVEAIQRMGVDQKTATKLNKTPVVANRDEVTFPKESEVWLDEVSHYQVKAKGCQPHGGTRL